MLHGRVVRPPSIGANLVSVDESSVQGMPGLVKVVVKKNFVGVVAEKPWQAIQAAAKLKATWSAGSGLPAQGTFYDHMRKSPVRDGLTVDSGDVDGKLAGAARVVKATYLYPYQMHGSIGSACAVADVQGEKVTVWSASQAVHPLRNTTAMMLGIPPAGVRIVFTMGPGCYGVNGADTVSYDAALMSQAVGKPVRVQLARQDEMAWENYGLAYVVDQRVALDADGTIVAWDYEGWSPTRGGRPGGNAPGNVVTGFLAGFEPQRFAPRTPAPPPQGGFDNGSNTAPSYVTGCVGPECGGCGVVKSERVLNHTVESPFFTGPLRSPARLQNTFAHECFMDEIAAQLKADPVEYRLRHLRDPRLRQVVATAAKTAGWEARPSPRAAARRTGVVAGRGIACVLYEGDNGYCANVTELEVNQDTGVIVVKRCVVAMDSGPISNPDGIRNQVEGGTLQGVSRTLLEEVAWNTERVTSVDWRSYHPLYLGADVPKVESVLINQSDVAAMGAGETAITVTAAAIGNAFFDATGVQASGDSFHAGTRQGCASRITRRLTACALRHTPYRYAALRLRIGVQLPHHPVLERVGPLGSRAARLCGMMRMTEASHHLAFRVHGRLIQTIGALRVHDAVVRPIAHDHRTPNLLCHAFGRVIAELASRILEIPRADDPAHPLLDGWVVVK